MVPASSSSLLYPVMRMFSPKDEEFPDRHLFRSCYFVFLTIELTIPAGCHQTGITNGDFSFRINSVDILEFFCCHSSSGRMHISSGSRSPLHGSIFLFFFCFVDSRLPAIDLLLLHNNLPVQTRDLICQLPHSKTMLFSRMSHGRALLLVFLGGPGLGVILRHQADNSSVDTA